LGSDQRVEELPATLNHGVNFTTAPTEMSIVVECFPKIIDRFVSRFSTGVNEYANLRLKRFQLNDRVLAVRLTSKILPMALNNHRCELIFF
jgi:hypothetical protein